MTVLQIKTNLFPDEETVLGAADRLEDSTQVDATQLAADDDAGWDDLVAKVLAADKILTV